AGQANYVADKSRFIGVTKSNAKELASRNILANVVAPGFITTDMTDALTEEQGAEILKESTLEKLRKSEGIDKDVCNVALNDENYITGKTIHIDGGMVM